MNIQGVHSSMLAATPVPMSSTSSTGSSSSTSSSSSQTANSAESTFIQLLVTELQSQDPTSPMDPATMVGQMFSMNQLQQLIDINQTLSTALGTSTTGTASSSAGNIPPATAVQPDMASSLLHAATQPTSAAASYAQQLVKGAL